MTSDETRAVPAGESDEDTAFAFHIEEFKQLREEIARHDNAKRQLEILAITGAALVTAWLVANNEKLQQENIRILWWLPLVLAVLGYSLSRSYVRRSKQIGRYIAKIEHAYAAKAGGWERFLDAERQQGGTVISTMTRIVWGAVFVMLALVALKFHGWEVVRGLLTRP